jgi:TolB-like protein/class 3 adenylate cyclase/Tfp pilus assembly protein PilF
MEWRLRSIAATQLDVLPAAPEPRAKAGNSFTESRFSLHCMSAEVKKEIQLEIAHVLFIDIVGYSKLSINEQRAAIDELNQAVRTSEQFQKAEAAARLIKIPTGDGMALVFYKSPEEPVECALEISRALKEHPRLQLRMGVHSGPVSGVIDVNGQANLAGAGLNMAQRVMDCGDAGHILLSKRVADDLGEYEHWRPLLHDLGECEVKHGMRVSIANLHADEVGNPQLPKKFQALKKHRTRVRLAATTAALLALAAVVAGIATLSRYRVGSVLAAPEKSIAVLPFENLSEEKANAFFTDGVQDEILTNLAKIADLKVISRTSVMQYKSGITRNLKEIAQQLGVAHVLEGSVQRSGDRVRVSAQLIDARTDMHLWAEHYDRELADVFRIQSEIAEKVVAQLKAKLSPQEKTAIEEKPTHDLAAYDLYLRARDLVDALAFTAGGTENLLEAVRLLDKAIARDPSFLVAHCHLARAHDIIYFLGIDHTPARLALADAAVQAALRLRPNAGEVHLALAQHLYWGYRDYDRARQELAIARRALPNEPLALVLSGYIDRRQGRWDESSQELESALELDPRNLFILQQIFYNYEYLRRFKDAAAVLDRVVSISPNDITTRAQRATVDLEWHADVQPLHASIESIITQDVEAAPTVSDKWMLLALCERDNSAAERALAVMAADACYDQGIPFPHAWCEGMVHRLRGDDAAAHNAFARARAEVEEIARKEPTYAEALSVLGMIDAALGKKAEAVREGQRAVELLPITKDALNGALMIQYFAITCAWAGEKKLALEQLAIAARIPSNVSYGHLRLHPYWDPLRGDPRFEQIVASLAPKAAP